MQVVTASNTTLFDLAARYLGDATQWVRIAALNGISDPWLIGLVTIEIPEIDTSAGGGLGTQ